MAIETADTSYRENTYHSRFMIKVKSGSSSEAATAKGLSWAFSGSSMDTQANMAFISRLEFGRLRSQQHPPPPPVTADLLVPGQERGFPGLRPLRGCHTASQRHLDGTCDAAGSRR